MPISAQICKSRLIRRPQTGSRIRDAGNASIQFDQNYPYSKKAHTEEPPSRPVVQRCSNPRDVEIAQNRRGFEELSKGGTSVSCSAVPIHFTPISVATHLQSASSIPNVPAFSQERVSAAGTARRCSPLALRLLGRDDKMIAAAGAEGFLQAHTAPGWGNGCLIPSGRCQFAQCTHQAGKGPQLCYRLLADVSDLLRSQTLKRRLGSR
jgi:hypothetical protein